MLFKSKNPLSGAPKTKQSVDAKGHPTFLITPFEFTPLRARLADGAAGLAFAAVLILSLLLILAHPRPSITEVAQIIGLGIVFGYVGAIFARSAFVQSTTIRMTTETISVRRWYHTCAIKSDNTVHCWGTNWHGQLGDNTNAQRLTAEQTWCGSPTGKAATLNYNSDFSVIQYCDGVGWVKVGK